MTKESARVYLLESFEGQVFLVEEDVALQSPLVRREGEKTGGVVLLEGADTESLRKVIEWCKMHTPEKKATVPPDEMRKWEDGYIDPCRVPLRLFQAVCYMEIKELEDWLGKRIVDAAIGDPVELGRKVLARIREISS